MPLADYEGTSSESASSQGGVTWTLTITWSDGSTTQITNIMNHSDPADGYLKVTGEKDGNAGLHVINMAQTRMVTWNLVSA